MRSITGCVWRVLALILPSPWSFWALGWRMFAKDWPQPARNVARPSIPPGTSDPAARFDDKDARIGGGGSDSERDTSTTRLLAARAIAIDSASRLPQQCELSAKIRRCRRPP